LQRLRPRCTLDGRIDAVAVKTLPRTGDPAT
jgi:hypothetical protein